MHPKLKREILERDRKLLIGFVNADNKILHYFYSSYLPSVTRYVCTNGGNEDDSRIVFQEVLLVLFKQAKSGKFHLSASLKTYIFSVCRFQWLKQIRKNKRIESLSEDFELADLNPDVVSLLENAEKFVLLQAHLSKLNTNDRKIMDLYFHKYSTRQIAETLGLSNTYIKKRKYECKKELIEAVQNDSLYKEMK